MRRTGRFVLETSICKTASLVENSGAAFAHIRHKKGAHLKKVILLILLATAASFAQQPAATASKAKIFTREEFDALMAKPGSVLLLDVRRPTEIATNGGFPVYLNIQAADLEKHLAEIPKGKPIITVSNHAHRAGIAADFLESKGFKIAGAIGAQVYESQGGKLVKYEPLKPAAENKQ